MERDNLFRVAGFDIRITAVDNANDYIGLIPSFAPFKTEHSTDEPLLTMTVDNGMPPRHDGDLVLKADTGNGITLVFKLPEGGYQYIIRNVQGHDCSMLQTNSDFSQCRCALNGTHDMMAFGLNDALMLAFTFAACRHQTLMIHASCVMNGGWAYPFTASSGTGKSTHSNLWMTHIPGTELMNDDNPIIRIADGEAYIYGSPWSGKTPCYRNVKARIGAITKIERAKQNSIERQPAVKGFGTMLSACSSMKWDSHLYNALCDTITKVIETVPLFTLHCLPDKEAALLCHKTIRRP